MRMNGGVPRLYDYFFRMIGRMVRELSRGIACSPEMKNIQRDLRNMAKDVQREFSSYQGRGDFSPNDEDGGWRQDNGQPHPDGDYTDAQSRPQYSAQNQYGTNRQGNSHVSVAPKNKYKTVSTAGILFTVFGGIGLGVFLIFLLMTTGLTLLTDMFGMPYLFLSIVLLILTGISIWMLAKGISLLKRTSRLKKYLKIVGSSQFCPIDMLVRESGFDHAFVLKDLQKMIQKRVLPDAHIDDQKTCLMLGDEIYQQYLYVQSQAQRRQQEEQRQRDEQQRQQEEQAFAGNPELAATIRQGREMIRRIRESNDRIEGEEVSAKMDRLEQIAEKIFEQVQEHPEKLPDIRKLMNYYLPTTLKLLDAYEEFDSQPVQGENIKTAKQQIEQTLDTINIAFENLLDKLFTDEVLDVSSDISVLETMLKQEGLTGSEFDLK